MKPSVNIEKKILDFTVKILAALVIISGIIPFSGWLIHRPLLASYGRNLIPMAPSTALIFVFSGVLMLSLRRRVKNKNLRLARLFYIIVSSAVLLVLLWFSWKGQFFSIETLGFTSTSMTNKLPTAHMSPLTAFSFLLVNGAFLILILNPQDSVTNASWAFGFSALVFLIALNLFLAYVFGAPVFYDQTVIPPALSTSMALIFLGYGLMTLAGKLFFMESIGLEGYNRKNSVLLAVVFLILVAGILISGNFYFRSFERNFRKQVGNNLISITNLKVHQMQLWRSERLRGAEVLSRDEDFAHLVKSFLEGDKLTGIRNRLEKRMRLELDAYNYDAFIIFDIKHKQQIAVPEIHLHKDSSLLNNINRVIIKQNIYFRDFYKNNLDKKIYLQILVPISDIYNPSELIAVAVLRINPYNYLYPQINEWPVVSETAETLLVRKEGDSVAFLNNLRFRDNSALNLKWPLTRVQLPAVKAVLGNRGIVEGIDYRNVPVLASVNSVPGSPWYIVARIDNSEIYAPLRERLRNTVFMISILILSLGLIVGFIWRQQSIKFYKEQYESATQIRKLNRIYNVLSNINQAIVRVRDPDELFRNVCSIAVEDGGFRMAWIGILNEKTMEVEVKATAGISNDYLQNLNISLDDPERGEGPTAKSIKNNCHMIVNDIATDHRMEAWRNRALALGYRSSAAFPLTMRGKPIGTFNLYSDEIEFFNYEEIKLLDELALDISFAMEFARQDDERRKAELAVRESEHILNQAQSVSKVGSWNTSLSDNSVTWSHETYRIFNIPEDTEISFDFFLSLVHPDDRERVKKVAEKSVEGSLYDIEHRILVNNQVRWVREKAEINYDPSGKPVRRIGTVQDITERKQADEKIHLLNAELEMRISQRTEELQEANKELEAFAYSVSHDLRAPLRSIIGYSNILKEDYYEKLDKEGHRVIQTIIKNTKRMGQLIDDLLEFSRMGRKSLSRDPVNMDEIVKDVVEDLRIHEHEREIKINVSKLSPCNADRNMMQQVWINLVSNALKYTRKKESALIEIGSEDEKEKIHYYIRDNGVGFDMRYSDKLFGVFQRLHTLDEFEGTGVGLALVKRIISRHSGDVWAEAEVNKGTTLHFTIPK